MNKYYISLYPEKEYTAWFKSIIDIEYFLSCIGFKPISIHDCIKDIKKCFNNIISYEEKENKGIIFVQYPRTSFDGLNLTVLTDYIKKNYKNFKTVVLVHDLDSIRYGDFFTTNILPEATQLNLFDYVIAVNDSMAALLKQHGVSSKISSMTIFDYVVSVICQEVIEEKNNLTVAFAGNLKYEKSPFVYQLNKLNLKNIDIMLYGPALNNEMFIPTDNVKYMGGFSANDLFCEINADYGLCWDGDSIEKCGGKIGKYLQYTNPHKTSFYLACGIPVIISADISTASFVKKENVGIIIDSLYDIPKALNNISNDEYKLLKENAVNLSKKLRNGYFIKREIRKIERCMRKEDSNA